MSTPITYYLCYFIYGLFNDGVSNLQQILSKYKIVTKFRNNIQQIPIEFVRKHMQFGKCLLLFDTEPVVSLSII